MFGSGKKLFASFFVKSANDVFDTEVKSTYNMSVAYLDRLGHR